MWSWLHTWFCWMWLVAVVGRCLVGCELTPYKAAPGYRNNQIFIILNKQPFWLYCFTKLPNRMEVPKDTCNCVCLSPQAFHKISTPIALLFCQDIALKSKVIHCIRLFCHVLLSMVFDSLQKCSLMWCTLKHIPTLHCGCMIFILLSLNTTPTFSFF